MLAPPPEGTFDIEDGCLPMKSPPENDSTPEQVPLLTQGENELANSNSSTNSSKKTKVQK